MANNAKTLSKDSGGRLNRHLSPTHYLGQNNVDFVENLITSSAGTPAITQGATPPATTDGFWLDTSGAIPVIKYYDGAAWVETDTTDDDLILGATAPTDTDVLWLDTSTTPAVLKQYDTTTSTWIETSDSPTYQERSVLFAGADGKPTEDNLNFNTDMSLDNVRGLFMNDNKALRESNYHAFSPAQNAVWSLWNPYAANNGNGLGNGHYFSMSAFGFGQENFNAPNANAYYFSTFNTDRKADGDLGTLLPDNTVIGNFFWQAAVPDQNNFANNVAKLAVYTNGLNNNSRHQTGRIEFSVANKNNSIFSDSRVLTMQEDFNQFNLYGNGSKTAAAISKTDTDYILGVTTDGSIIEKNIMTAMDAVILNRSYADNAQALTGGLVAGQAYYDTTGGYFTSVV